MRENSVINIKRSHIVLLFISLAVFGLITFTVQSFSVPLENMEGDINDQFRSVYGTPGLDFDGGFFNDMMSLFTLLGESVSIVVITFILAAVLMIKRYTLLSFWVLAVVSTGGLIGVLLKNTIERSRPPGHLAVDDGFSYPSGHSIASALLFLIIILVLIPHIKHQFLKYAACTITVLIWMAVLYSRLYFGAHYLTDVLGGAFFALLYVLTAMYIYDKSSLWFKKYIFKRGRI